MDDTNTNMTPLNNRKGNVTPPSVEDLDEEKDFVEDKIMKKNILYSEKSESSIDEMMEDTPSNYNIPNGRLDGKSIGLKALLL